MANQILIISLYVSCYNIEFEHEVKTGEMDLHPTVSSFDTPELTLVVSL